MIEINYIKICLIKVIILIVISQNLLGSVYDKKGITVIPYILIEGKRIKIKEKEKSLIITEVKNALEMKRFFVNKLPDKIFSVFSEKLSAINNPSIEVIKSHIKTYLVPEIFKILDAEKEIRAREFESETEKHSFIVLKAKEIGISADEIIKVYNLSYIALPYIRRFTVVKNSEENKVKVKISGGIYWFQISYYPDTSIKYIKKISSEGVGISNLDKTYYIFGKKYSPYEFALNTAVSSFALNLQSITKNMECFKLNIPIAEIEKRFVYLPLSKRDGLKEDYPFLVGEWIEDEAGNTDIRYSGFIRIMKTSPNSSIPSKALAIKKGDWAKGMLAVEYPYIGIDIAVKPRLTPININHGAVLTEDFLLIFGDYKGLYMAADISFNLSISSYIHSFQSFLVAGVSGGLIPVKTLLYDDIHSVILNWPEQKITAGLVEIHTGYLKRYYIGSLAVHFEVLSSFQRVYITNSYKGDDVYIYNNSIGFRLNSAIEYAMNINSNIGFFLGIDLFPPLNWWSVKYKGKEQDVENFFTYDYPKIYTAGISCGIYYHFSVPQLIFNPFAIIQSILNTKY